MRTPFKSSKMGKEFVMVSRQTVSFLSKKELQCLIWVRYTKARNRPNVIINVPLFIYWRHVETVSGLRTLLGVT